MAADAARRWQDAGVVPKKFTILLAFAALYLIWGSTYLGILFAIQTIPPLLMAGIRYSLAGLIMYAIARIGGAPRGSLGDWKTASIVGACLLLGGNGGVTFAEQYVPSGLASLIVATVPIYIALLGWLMGMAPKPTPLVWLGLAGGFAGVAVLVGPALTFSSPSHSHLGLGMIILLVGSFLWSAGSLYSRTAGNAPSPFLAAGQQMLCGGLMLVAAGSIIGEWPQFHLRAISALSFWAFVYLVLIGAVVGFTAYIFLLRHCDPRKVATYAYVNPVVAIVLGALFASEELSTRTAIGAALIVGSVALVITAQQAKPKTLPPSGAAVTVSD